MEWRPAVLAASTRRFSTDPRAASSPSTSTPMGAAAPTAFGIVDPFGCAYQLSKPVLSALVVGSGTAGFLMAGSPIHLGALAAVTCGTFLTAFSANTFNQCYEVKTDALMKRTMSRPLPSGKLTIGQARAWGVLCGVAGAGVLAAGCNELVALLGVGNIALYAMVYTPMKQTSKWNTWVSE
jgi:protoheme IX farnesyltransferase